MAMAMNKEEIALAVAAEWARRLELGDLSDRDWSDFEAWLGESEVNREAFDDAQRAWTATRVQELERTQILALAPDEGRYGRFSRIITSLIGSIRPTRPAVLSTFVVVATVATLYMATVLWRPVGTEPLVLVQTGYGQTNALELEDGSTVELNTDTTLGYRYSENERLVEIQNGEAYFEVKKDLSRRFEITAGNNVVSVLGTAFNLKYVDRVLEVSVIEGVVSVVPGPSASTIRLRKGECLEISESGQFSKREANPLIALAWRNGAIAFENETLAAILTDLDRYYPEQLSIKGVQGTEVYTGLIYVDDLEEALHQLSTISSTQISFDETQGLQVDER